MGADRTKGRAGGGGGERRAGRGGEGGRGGGARASPAPPGLPADARRSQSLKLRGCRELCGTARGFSFVGDGRHRRSGSRTAARGLCGGRGVRT